MKITSGLLRVRYSMAASADSAASTAISCRSRMRTRNARADLESSTTKARLADIKSPPGGIRSSRFVESVASARALRTLRQIARRIFHPGFVDARRTAKGQDGTNAVRPRDVTQRTDVELAGGR